MNDSQTTVKRRLSRAEAKARTRQELLDAAAGVFADRGFGGASLEMIAQAAGYTTGAVYANFDNKEQLFLELLAARRGRGRARRVAAVAEALNESSFGTVDPFDTLARYFVQMADRRPEHAPLEAEFWLYAVRHPEAMDAIAASRDDQVDALVPLVAVALERMGVGGGVDPRAVTTASLALVQGLVRQRRIDAAGVPDQLFAESLRWLFVGVAAGNREDG